MLTIECICPMCGEVNIVKVNKEGYEKWKRRELKIQDALPELTPAKREMLMTGICDDCWDLFRMV